MGKREWFSALLSKGYFPEELPPPFHTTSFATYRNSINLTWGSVSNLPKTKAEIYSYPRIGPFRRNLAVVNPISQIKLCSLISDNWVQIRKEIRKSTWSFEPLEILSDKERAIPKPDFNKVTLERLKISASYNHILVSDISRFYGTLYTHAIPWALHGKKWCKTNLNNRVLGHA